MMLRDKFLEVARISIEEQEGVPATIEEWQLIPHHRAHKVVAQVMVMAGQNCAFEVWVVADLDTEEVTCI